MHLGGFIEHYVDDIIGVHVIVCLTVQTWVQSSHTCLMISVIHKQTREAGEPEAGEDIYTQVVTIGDLQSPNLTECLCWTLSQSGGLISHILKCCFVIDQWIVFHGKQMNRYMERFSI